MKLSSTHFYKKCCQTPENISIASNGNNLWVAGISGSSYLYRLNGNWRNAKVVSATEPMEVHLAVYENNVWKKIFNNYTKYVSPSDIESNNGIYFVFGDENSLANGYPTVLNAKILTK